MSKTEAKCNDYKESIGTNKDLYKAEGTENDLDQKAAENGDKFAQYNLGRCYEYGIGIQKDEIKAFELYKVAAKQGHNFAQNSLGLLYENGKGIEKDLEKAFYWYNKSAENGNEVTQYNKGRY